VATTLARERRDVLRKSVSLGEGRDDVAKLLDFGLARPVETCPAADLSAEGQILGTPLFISPEQATADRELDQPMSLQEP
jgi:serine/threonine-protein kinase